MTGRVTTKLGAALVGVALLMVNAASAQGSQVASGCDSGMACFYQNTYYGGTHFETSIASSNWDWPGNIWAMRYLNDRDSSVVNYWGTYPVTWYRHDSYSGYIHCLSRGVAMKSYTSEDDQGSSHRAAGSSC